LKLKEGEIYNRLEGFEPMAASHGYLANYGYDEKNPLYRAFVTTATISFLTISKDQSYSSLLIFN
jgi:hypothetical protein